jgi:hypothetical protein
MVRHYRPDRQRRHREVKTFVSIAIRNATCLSAGRGAIRGNASSSVGEAGGRHPELSGPVFAPTNVMEFSALLQRVRAEFNEMPGLRLTPAQAGRLLGLDASSCQRVLNALVGADFLKRMADGSVVRSES